MEVFTYEGQLYLVVGINGQFVITIKAERPQRAEGLVALKEDKINVKNGAEAYVFPIQLVHELILEQREADRPLLEQPK